MNIKNPNILDMMAQIEGPSWKKTSLTDSRHDTSFLFVQSWHAKKEAEVLEGIDNGEYTGEWADEDIESFLTNAVGTIYGDGGWNRWYVLGSGEVVFSKHHSTEKNQKKATELGFRLW